MADELARNFVLVVLVILLVMSTFLVLTAVILRKKHERDEAYRLRKKEELYPLILNYLDLDPANTKELEKAESGIIRLLKTARDLEVIEDLILEIMYNIAGAEKLRLRQLLLIQPLYTQRYRQLKSWRIENLIQGCLYFVNVINQRSNVLEQIFPLLDNRSVLVLHTAASAIFACDDVATRGRALEKVCRRTGISEMALLELVYKFHNKEFDQMDEEVSELKRIISDRSVPNVNRGVIIKSVADIGYATMADYLYNLISTMKESDNGVIANSLIHAMGRFEYTGAAGLLAEKFSDALNVSIRETLADTLGQLGNKESIPVLIRMSSDADFGVRVRAVYALAALGEPGYEPLRAMEGTEDEIQRIAASIIAQMETGNQKEKK
ncbi:MAG: HEAT repeat domain-containing protein [Cyclonatronaceae bacterium]